MKKKSFLVLIAVLCGVGVTIASQPKKDPLLAEIESLEKTFNATFHDPDNRPGTLLNALEPHPSDIRLALGSMPLVRLQNELMKMRVRIEGVSRERGSFEVTHAMIQSLVEVSARYLGLQRRLYANYIRNAHEKIGDEKSYIPDFYDFYNLTLMNNVGLAIIQSPKHMLKYNVRHVADEQGHYERVQLGLTPQDKDQVEEAVLKSRLDEASYAKLIQFITIRERIVNHWDIQRMSNEILPDVNLNGCGAHFVSFKNEKDPDFSYVRSLGREDQYEAYSEKVKSKLASLTRDYPLVTPEAMARILKKYVFSIPEFQIDVLPIAKKQEIEKYIGRGVSETLIGKVEGVWGKQATTNLLLANYVGDPLSNDQEVADRITWNAFENRKILMIKQLIAESIQSGTAAITSEENPKLLERLATEAVLSEVTPKVEAQWRSGLKSKIVGYLAFNSKSKEIDQRLRNQRFQDIADLMLPTVGIVGEAVWVKNKIDDFLKQGETCYHPKMNERPSCEWYRALQAAELSPTEVPTQVSVKPAVAGFIPVRKHLDARLEAHTPDQLSLYFYKKLRFWEEQDRFPELSKRAKEISRNFSVQKGIKNFFGALAEDYLMQTQLGVVKQSNVYASADLTYKNLDRIALSSYDDFLKYLDEHKGLKPPLLFPKQTAAFDRPGPWIPRPVEEVNDVPLSPEAKAYAHELYVDAMAMMGLGRIITQRSSSELVTNRFYAKSFFKVESLLEDVSPEGKKVRNRVALSLLDQQLMADALFGAALSQYPILALQDKEFTSMSLLTLQKEYDSDSPTLLEHLATLYKPEAGLNTEGAKFSIGMRLKTLAQEEQGLVQEACDAKPFEDYNQDWRNVFRSSTATRKVLQETISAYKPFDEHLMRTTRTHWEYYLEEYIDPIASFLFKTIGYASLALLLLSGIGGAAGLVALGSWSAGSVGIMNALGISSLLSMGASSTASSMFMVIGRKVLGTIAGKFMTYVFTTQILMMGYVNYIELPYHLKYQLGVANSQVGLFGQLTTDRKQVEVLANQIFAKKISTGVMMALQATMMRPMISDFKAMLGILTRGALARQTVGEAEKAIAQEMTVKTLEQTIRENGGSVLKGGLKWMGTTLQNLVVNGRITTLSEAATQHQADLLMQHQLYRLYPTPQVYRELIQARIDAIGIQGAKLKAAVLGSQDPTVYNKVMTWLRDALSYRVVKAGHWNLAFTTRAKTLIMNESTGGVSIAKGQKGFWEWAVKAYMTELHYQRNYFKQRLQVLSYYEMENAGKPSVNVMKEFLETFNSSDIQQHEEVMKWLVRQTSSNFITAWIKETFGTTEQIRLYQQMFKDYRALSIEIQKVQPKQKTESQHENTNSAASDAEKRPDPSEAEDLIVVDVDPLTGELIYSNH